MLLGEFNHSIDEKGRLIIPAKLRDDLGDSFVICNGLEGCLFVYSQEEWNKFVAELETLPRMSKDARIFKRYFFGSASEGSFDKQGRVLVPPSLRKAAGLEKDVVLVGVQDRIEIWDKALWGGTQSDQRGRSGRDCRAYGIHRNSYLIRRRQWHLNMCLFY